MGSEQSRPVAAGEALHVVRVLPNSPAAAAGITPIMDYVVGVNGAMLGADVNALATVLASSIGTEVVLEVYSAVNRDFRAVHVVPSVTWGSDEGLLGISVRACNYVDALKSWHVIDVVPGSPADMAGLRAEEDYIIGSRQGVLRDKEDLFDLIEENVDRSAVHLAVYAKDTETCREVVIFPTRSWGGEGALGCSLGFGLLHQIPPQRHYSDPPKASDSYMNLPAVPPPIDLPATVRPDLAHADHSHGDHSHGEHTHADHLHGDHSHGDHAYADHGDHTHADHSHGDHAHAEHLHGGHDHGGHSHGDHSHDSGAAVPSQGSPTRENPSPQTMAAGKARELDHDHDGANGHSHSHDAPVRNSVEAGSQPSS
ncbi:GRASP55/65 PDZ-like domain-containing protein [Hyaloraphidium curvatum]|nr:GRASP55/65 PDZ-like domain-containing protein [Hyaloraphidium curvatum]